MEAIHELEKADKNGGDFHAAYRICTRGVLCADALRGSSNLGRFDGMRYGYHSTGTNLTDSYERSRGEGFGAKQNVGSCWDRTRFRPGQYDAYYRKALKVRSLIKQDFDETFKRGCDCDTTSPSVAWKLGEKFGNPLTMYLSDIYTITANLATIPYVDSLWISKTYRLVCNLWADHLMNTRCIVLENLSR